MRIKMIESTHVPGKGTYEQNAILNIDEDLAKDLIARGQAESFEPSTQVEVMVDQVEVKKPKKSITQ